MIKNLLLNIVNNQPRQYNIAGKNLREEKLLSEGAFAFVWHVRDIKTNESFALKKILCQDKERIMLAKHEINILKCLPAHQNLVRYYGYAQETVDNITEYQILMEICDGGHLLDFLDKEKGQLSENRIINIFLEILSGLNQLHILKEPIAHRDLKVENILLSSDQHFKICDFGSCSKNFIDTKTCTKEQLLEERASIEQYTTMMYRAPEMIDLHRKYKINEKVDIWMMGCILFTLAFYRHPFQNLNNLAISNAKFEIPINHNYSKKLTDLIIWIFSIEPNDRPSSALMINILSSYSTFESLPLPPNISKRCESYYESAQQKYVILQKPYTPLEKPKRKTRPSNKLPKEHFNPHEICNLSQEIKKNNLRVNEDLLQYNKNTSFVTKSDNHDLFDTNKLNQNENSIFNYTIPNVLDYVPGNSENNWADFSDSNQVNEDNSLEWDYFNEEDKSLLNDKLSNFNNKIDSFEIQNFTSTYNSGTTLDQKDNNIDFFVVDPFLPTSQFPNGNDDILNDDLFISNSNNENKPTEKDTNFDPFFNNIFQENSNNDYFPLEDNFTNNNQIEEIFFNSESQSNKASDTDNLIKDILNSVDQNISQTSKQNTNFISSNLNNNSDSNFDKRKCSLFDALSPLSPNLISNLSVTESEPTNIDKSFAQLFDDVVKLDNSK